MKAVFAVRPYDEKKYLLRQPARACNQRKTRDGFMGEWSIPGATRRAHDAGQTARRTSTRSTADITDCSA